MDKPLTTVSRRLVIGGLLATPFVVRPAEALSRARSLSMLHLHTKENIKATYWRNGRYDPAAWVEINEFMRDWRTDDIHAMDPRVLDILHYICGRMRHLDKVEILSGYRSPKTNRMLRENSGGVARNSYHVKGQAIDFYLPGKSLRKTYRTAVGMKAGGVGLYTGSHFIHIDSGPARTWGS